MQRTFTPYSQLVAFYDYQEDELRLIITLKDGNRYIVNDFNTADYSCLNKARNKGSHIYQNVFKNKDFIIRKGEKIATKDLEAIIQQHYNRKNKVFRFRESEGWGNHLAR